MGLQPAAAPAAPVQLEESTFHWQPAGFTVCFHLWNPHWPPAPHALSFFHRKKNIYILFLPVSCNYCSWVHSGIPAPLTNNLYSVADLRGSQPPAFTASCCSPPGPPKGASPAPFPHCWGAGRGPNGGKQIIYKHFPKKKKKSSHTHTQMPPQVETHTIFEPMEEASSGRSCQEDQITFILPLFCLTDFLYGLLL